MSEATAKILELRELIAQKEGKLSLRERLPSSTLSCGIPRAAITEIAGSAKIEWILQFLKENALLKVFWVEADFTLFPTGIHQRGLQPSRFVFAEGGDDVFKTLRGALRCQVFECVVAPNAFPEEKMLKALQLLSEKSNASVLLLNESLQASWPITTQFEVHRGPRGRGFEIELKKNKGTSEQAEGQA